MAKGLQEMRHLRKEDLNKLNELKNDFLLYGQYSSEHIDKIVQTIKGLQNKTSKVEEVLMGMHREWSKLFLKNRCRSIHIWIPPEYFLALHTRKT